MKKFFKLAEYSGKYDCMRCNTQEKARQFLDFLSRHGRKWCDGGSYNDIDHWGLYGERTCYYFNMGCYGFEQDGDRVLEFDDFFFNARDCVFMNRFCD